MELSLGADAPRRARHAAREILQSWQEIDADRAFDAQLVASEFVTNAVIHGGAEVVLELRVDADALVVAVCDGSAVLPTPRQPGGHDESGRGLGIVAALAEGWGVEALSGGHKRVWARIRVH